MSEQYKVLVGLLVRWLYVQVHGSTRNYTSSVEPDKFLQITINAKGEISRPGARHVLNSTCPSVVTSSPCYLATANMFILSTRGLLFPRTAHSCEEP